MDTSTLTTEQIADLLTRTKLAYREKIVIELLFGSGSGTIRYTHAEVGRILKTTEGRVRKLEASAREKLLRTLEKENEE
jgi:DNA-directed RNA polymerase sigma subunit (sigma70/sigma32)